MAEGTMASMPGMPMPGPPAGTLAYFTAASLMWLLMMTAMMLPSASPMILLYARVTGRMRADGASLAPTFVFAGVYLALWSLFAMAAGGLQAALVHWGVLHAGLLSLRAQAAAGILLLLAGAYQFTSAKQACLDRCRAPLSLLVNWWRPGWASSMAFIASAAAGP